MATMTVRRFIAELKDHPRSVVEILPEVLNGPAGVPGPYWVLSPSPAMQSAFWSRFGAELRSTDRVFVMPGGLPVDLIRDVDEQRLPAFAGVSGRVDFFFIDREPDANWAHPCVYVAATADVAFLRAEHQWPPADAIDLRELRRPGGVS